MKIGWDDIIFWVPAAGALCFAATIVPSLVTDDFLEVSRPQHYMHDGVLYPVEPSTEHISQEIGGELMILDVARQEMVNNASILAVHEESALDWLIDRVGTGDTAYGTVLYTIGDGEVRRADITDRPDSPDYFTATLTEPFSPRM